ncbi:MAG TPA: glycosyltransferase family 39 protein [Candidatus Acidoferrum sp.]|nr:glycosyltransferase family 39 protein [Candidatus Acidoferrum sp.]
MLVVLLASLAVNIVAIVDYPAWMDEAIISDLVYDYFRDTSYVSPDFLYATADEGRIYGPVYFYLQTLLLNVLGDDPFVFRLANLLASYLLVVVVARLFQARTGDKKITVWLVVILLLSFAINKSAVSGRMDMLATLFAMFSLWCAHRYRDGSLRALLASSLFASLAFLTTPRTLFLLPATLVLLGYAWVDQHGRKPDQRRMVLHVAIAALVFLGPIALWIQAVGGVREYAGLFLNPEMAQFYGPSVFRNWRDWIYLPVLLGVLLLHWRHIRRDPLVVACIATVIVFSLFVTEVGPYRAMIMPYILLLGALAVGLAPDGERRSMAALALAGVVLAISIPFFVGRAVDIFYVNRDCRDAEDFERRVLANVPKQLTILADYRFYYLLKGRPAIYSPGNIEDDDFFRRSGYPDRILLGEDSVERAAEPGSPLHPVLRDEYEVVTSYVCAVHDMGLGGIFESRRNFHDATLYRRKTVAGNAGQ